MLANELDKIANHLATITGDAHARREDDVINVSPASTEEVSSILHFANGHGLAVCPYGGGTKQHWGNTVRPTLILHTHRLNGLREHTWQDMTATVEAGCTWSSMQSVLAKHGQFVALDPLWPDRATVGGIVATNDSGALRLKYGSLRDLVIGMTIVLADGTIAHTGGKVVKNVAGYDLHKLMIRSFGTLGIVTEVTFRLHAIPQHTVNFSVTSNTAGPLGNLLLKVLDSHLSSQAVQLRAGGDFCSLDVQLTAHPEALHAQATVLATMAEDFGLTVDGSREHTWNASQEQVNQQAEVLTVKATMLPSEISYFSDLVRALGGASVTQATGIMITRFPTAAAEALQSLRLELETAGGSLTVLQQPSDANLEPWGSLPDTFPLMSEIKRRFDPNRILNPGRFLGGI